MPNWTTNTWSIEGDNETLDTVRKALRDELFDFDVFIPTPEELSQTQSPVKVVDTQEKADTLNKAWQERMAKHGWKNRQPIVAITDQEHLRRTIEYGATDWYNYQIKRWGVKWRGADMKILCDEPRRIVVRFITAWEAPHPIAEYIESLGLSVHGGGIYEDGDEFVLLGDDQAAFNERFTVIEEEMSDGDYEWVNRRIDWLGDCQEETAAA